MNRGAFERRLSHVDDAIRGLLSNKGIILLRFLTMEELDKFRDLRGKAKGSLKAKIAPEVITELIALLEASKKRLKAKLSQV